MSAVMAASRSSGEQGFDSTASHPARPARAGSCVRGSIPGDGEHGNRARPRIRFEAARQFVPVDPGDIEIGYDDRGEQVECPLEGLQAIVCLLDTEACLLQPLGVHQAPLTIVFNQHYRAALRVKGSQRVLPEYINPIP